MKTKLYIVRHAETIGNIEKRLTGRKDYELTEKGLASTEKLAKRLSNIKFDVMYSSTSNRTSIRGIYRLQSWTRFSNHTPKVI